MKSLQAGFWLLIVLATVCLTEGRTLRTRRELRYRQNVAYAYQYRTDQIASVQKVPLVPVVVPSVHIQNQLLQHEKTKLTAQAHVLHFPTRRPMQAVDQLHTRVDIGQHRRRGTVPVLPVVPVIPVVPVVPAVATVPGTVVAHSHTEVYRKYR
uniref:Uncharacterized protein n=1 Tax=Anopheles maculatus TaxID=74869 RepID=A0A182SLZ7_9DIPT